MESLRALRRGLQLAEGFAPYIAVCNGPATIRSLIDVLQESMPGVEVETIELDERMEDPLARVLDLSSPDKSGPLMILGLERSCPSTDPDHPVLHVLNLQRPEWPKRIPRPVVLWIPEYLLSLLGSEAPDFLDWRSDTLFFPSEAAELHALTSAIWVEGLDGRMPEKQRRARIEELLARLRSTSSAMDPVVQSARSTWLNELGNHLLILGHVADAEKAYKAFFDIEIGLNRRRGMSVASKNLGIIAMYRHNLKEAEERFERSLSIAREIGDLPLIASTSGNLGLIAVRRKDLVRGEELILQALDFYEQHRESKGMAIACGNLALIYLRQGRLEDAEPLLLKAISLSEEVGDRMAAAGHYRILAEAFRLRGDHSQAEELIRRALTIDEELGNQTGIAANLGRLGAIYMEQGNDAAARESVERAQNIYRALGLDSRAETLDNLLGSLPAVST